MADNKVLIRKFESRIRSNEKEIDKLRKTIRGYGFRKCQTRRDFRSEKLKLSDEFDDIGDEIQKAGMRYDSSSVVALKNRQGRIRTKINEINDILVLFDKIDELIRKIKNLKLKIKRLEEKTEPSDSERKQMNIVLKAMRNNCSRDDAARIAGIELKRVVNWIHEGRNGTNENKMYFYRQYSKIESARKRKSQGF